MAKKKRRSEEETRAKNQKKSTRKSKNGQNSSGNQKRGRRKRMSIGAKIALIICAILLVFVIAAIVALASKMSKIESTELDVSKLSISDELEYDETGYLNVALFGLDTRENNEEMGSRSDTIMIASLNRETKDVKLVSIYRDTLLQQEDGSYNKANAAYSYGGAEEAVALLNRNLDMDIRYYVTVDFAALVDVIDALGGIQIEVTEEEIPYINGYAVEIIENTGVDTWAVTEPGLQNLTGVQATAYARIRYTAGDDFKRAERQRMVLTKIAEKAQTASLSTLNNIIDSVFPKIETNFTMFEILAYAKDIKKYNLCETTGFPEERGSMMYNEQDCVVPVTLESNVLTLHKYLFGDDGYSPTSTVKAINSEISYLYSVYGSGGSSDTGNYSSYDSGYDDTGDGNSYDSGYDSGTDYYNDTYTEPEYDDYGSDSYNDYDGSSNYDDYGDGGWEY